MPFFTPLELARLRHPRPVPVMRPIAAAARPLLDRASADPQARETIAARQAWQAHVDAGRIGQPAPPPAGPGDMGCAALAAILGIAHPTGGRA